MRTPSPFAALVALMLALLGSATCTPADAPAHAAVVSIVSVRPHDPAAFTQGLFYHAGKLYESTGQYGESSVRICDPDSGKVLIRRDLDRDSFGEGLARLGDAALQLTWKRQKGFIYDLKTLEPVSEFNYHGEGWGLASSERGLVMSDGSATLTFLDTSTLKPLRTIVVRENGREIRQLNELEWYGKVLLANIWMRDEAVAVDPDSGAVLARIDLSPLRAELPKSAGVANGIAYDAATGRLFMTGKYWNKLFEVRITPGLDRE